ncbi:MAG: hypothetical protein MZU95_10410 [Desulfomicrobium escambiense]|nr:hypothetical protein [Desulfomicrobium escambiense]
MLSSVYLSVAHARVLPHRPAGGAGAATSCSASSPPTSPVKDLLRDAKLAAPLDVQWKQFRGDPSVRGTVFLQTRSESVFDRHFDAAIEQIDRLMREHGVFHGKIHFSSGRCSFWLFDDPYGYRLHGIAEIIDPELCAWPTRIAPVPGQRPHPAG